MARLRSETRGDRQAASKPRYQDGSKLRFYGVECAGTIVEDRPHGLCPKAASLVLRRNDVAQLKASVVGVSAVIVDHANASTV